METTINQNMDIRLSEIVERIKAVNIDDFVTKLLQDSQKPSVINYIGEYNTTDLMF